MGWRHYTIQTLKAVGLLTVAVAAFSWWIMSVLVACASGRGKGMH